MMPPYRHMQRGLTLVELLLGLAITATLTAPLAALFGTAAASGSATRTALDLNADARFALDRIAVRAAAASTVSTANGIVAQPSPAPPPAPPVPAGTAVPALTLVMGTDKAATTVSYALAGSDLVETEVTGPASRSGVIASNVGAIVVSAPASGNQPLLRIDLAFAAPGGNVSIGRTFRVGSPQ